MQTAEELRAAVARADRYEALEPDPPRARPEPVAVQAGLDARPAEPRR